MQLIKQNAIIQNKLSGPLEQTGYSPVTGKTDLGKYADGEHVKAAAQFNSLSGNNGQVQSNCFINKRWSALAKYESVPVFRFDSGIISNIGSAAYDGTKLSMQWNGTNINFTDGGKIFSVSFPDAIILEGI